jgi:hypothetical protein
MCVSVHFAEHFSRGAPAAALASGWWASLLLFNVLNNGYPVLFVRQVGVRLQQRVRCRWVCIMPGTIRPLLVSNDD